MHQSVQMLNMYHKTQDALSFLYVMKVKHNGQGITCMYDHTASSAVASQKGERCDPNAQALQYEVQIYVRVL